MFQHRLLEDVSLKTYLDWFTLSFLAGNINAGGYLACHRFVSHVTGFATLAGISFEAGSILDAIGNLAIPGFFLAGVMVSGILTENRYAHKVHGQRYAPVMGTVAVLLGIVSVGGMLNWFGEFGDPAKVTRDFLLMACLCGACGLQNGAITLASGFTIRTTHLTGLTTDLGLGLVRVQLHEMSKEQRAKEKKANWLRISTIAAFAFGSLAGAVVFTHFRYAGFFFPMLIAIYFAYTARRSCETRTPGPGSEIQS